MGDKQVRTGIGGAQREVLQLVTPLGRPGTVEEAAGAVFLFCIPERSCAAGVSGLAAA